TQPLPVDQLNEEINNAIEKDEREIEISSIPLAQRVSPALKQIDLYWLKRPHEILKTIIDRPHRRIKDGSVRVPDLWVRREDKSRRLLTINGRHWVYAKPTEKIDMAKERLDIDVVDVDGKGGYIVAALHEENGQEIPIVLGEDCCQSRCGTLKRHLETLWRDRKINKALRLTSEHKLDPSNPVDIAMHDDLSTHPLDDD
ncbi:10084_t:CDS:2, partial [Acaulospora colombiana]